MIWQRTSLDNYSTLRLPNDDYDGQCSWLFRPTFSRISFVRKDSIVEFNGNYKSICVLIILNDNYRHLYFVYVFLSNKQVPVTNTGGLR